MVSLAAAMALTGTACGSGEAPPAKELITERSSETLNIRIAEDVKTLDPYEKTNDSEFTVISQIYEPLYRLADDTSEIPVLATEYVIEDVGLTYTFTLRDDVTFSNGEMLTAEDVKYSLERSMAAASPSSTITFIESVEADEEAHEVSLHMSIPAPGLIADLSNVPIICQTFAEEHADENGSLGFNACGTGPYVYAEHVSGSYVSLGINENYYGELPAIPTLNFVLISDEYEAVNALRNNRLDIIMGLSADAKEELADNEAVSTMELPENHVTFIVINTEQPLFENKYIRRAISTAINKEALISETQNGGAVADSMATPYMIGYSDIEPRYSYDLTHTRQLLNGCGYLESLDIGEIQVLTDSYLADVGTVLQKQLAEADIHATVTELDARELFNNCMSGSFNIAVMVQNNAYDMNWLSTFYGSEYIDNLNMARYSDEELDELLVKASVSIDPERRMKIYNEALIEAEKSCAYIPLFNRSICHVWATELNYTPSVHTPIFSLCSWEQPNE